MLAEAEGGYALSTPQPGWAEQDPEDWWRAARGRARRGCPTGRSGSRARCTASSCSARAGEVLRPAILWNDGRTGAECAEIEERVGLERLIELTGNRALAGLHRAEAALAAQARARRLRADPPRAAAEGLRPLPADRRARRSTRPTRRGRCSSTSRTAAGRRRSAPRSRSRSTGCREAYESTEVGGRGRPGRGGARARHRPARPRVGRARHVRASSSRCCPATSPTARRACTSSATRCPGPGTRWA